jgi:hypothetical protein
MFWVFWSHSWIKITMWKDATCLCSYCSKSHPQAAYADRNMPYMFVLWQQTGLTYLFSNNLYITTPAADAMSSLHYQRHNITRHVNRTLNISGSRLTLTVGYQPRIQCLLKNIILSDMWTARVTYLVPCCPWQ